eukprot:TRINITY_DN979_c1_g2_i1.p1 TRINITY_DN979_c1_g2~~TRINITY_DN979_c1_g2_i1.p1  ORF type:complete len:424 (-),score=183.55 TRINITY_DN979_c1_g2_i1:14-1285(-)
MVDSFTLKRKSQLSQQLKEQEESVAKWMGEVLSIEIPSEKFWERIRDGVILCRVMLKIKPGSLKEPKETSQEFLMMENVQRFVTACTDYGIGGSFLPGDLVNRTNQTSVLSTIMRLGVAANDVGFLPILQYYSAVPRGPRVREKTSPNSSRRISVKTKSAPELPTVTPPSPTSTSTFNLKPRSSSLVGGREKPRRKRSVSFKDDFSEGEEISLEELAEINGGVEIALSDGEFDEISEEDTGSQVEESSGTEVSNESENERLRSSLVQLEIPDIVAENFPPSPMATRKISEIPEISESILPEDEIQEKTPISAGLQVETSATPLNSPPKSPEDLFDVSKIKGSPEPHRKYLSMREISISQVENQVENQDEKTRPRLRSFASRKNYSSWRSGKSYQELIKERMEAQKDAQEDLTIGDSDVIVHNV